MALNIDITQDKKIKFVISAIVAMGALTGVLLYFDQKKHMKFQREIFELDKGIKQLQLQKLKNGDS